MANEELLSEISKLMQQQTERYESLLDERTGRFESLLNERTNRFESLLDERTNRFESLLDKRTNRFEALLDEHTRSINLKIENEVSKRIDSLFDGYVLTHEKQRELEISVGCLEERVDHLENIAG